MAEGAAGRQKAEGKGRSSSRHPALRLRSGQLPRVPWAG